MRVVDAFVVCSACKRVGFPGFVSSRLTGLTMLAVLILVSLGAIFDLRFLAVAGLVLVGHAVWTRGSEGCCSFCRSVIISLRNSSR